MEVLKVIKRTIKYSQKYGGKLNEDELFERLIGDQVYKKSEFKNVVKTHPPFGHPTLKKEEVNNDYLLKVKKAEELAKEIEEEFEDILFLGITGSVAAGSPKKNSDIDLMIITKANKLWINRLKLRWFIAKNKIPHRKPEMKEKTDEFCFNLWLDEKSLKIKGEKQNLKNAVDLILIKPLINKNKTYEKFILENDWVKKWVATGYSLKKPSALINWGISLNRAALFDGIINWLVFWPQFWYMKRKMKNEKIGLHEAFFHH